MKKYDIVLLLIAIAAFIPRPAAQSAVVEAPSFERSESPEPRPEKTQPSSGAPQKPLEPREPIQPPVDKQPIKTLDEQIKTLEEQAESYTRANKPVPTDLARRIVELNNERQNREPVSGPEVPVAPTNGEQPITPVQRQEGSPDPREYNTAVTDQEQLTKFFEEELPKMEGEIDDILKALKEINARAEQENKKSAPVSDALIKDLATAQRLKWQQETTNKLIDAGIDSNALNDIVINSLLDEFGLALPELVNRMSQAEEFSLLPYDSALYDAENSLGKKLIISSLVGDKTAKDPIIRAMQSYVADSRVSRMVQARQEYDAIMSGTGFKLTLSSIKLPIDLEKSKTKQGQVQDLMAQVTAGIKLPPRVNIGREISFSSLGYRDAQQLSNNIDSAITELNKKQQFTSDDQAQAQLLLDWKKQVGKYIIDTNAKLDTARSSFEKRYTQEEMNATSKTLEKLQAAAKTFGTTQEAVLKDNYIGLLNSIKQLREATPEVINTLFDVIRSLFPKTIGALINKLILSYAPATYEEDTSDLKDWLLHYRLLVQNLTDVHADTKSPEIARQLGTMQTEIAGLQQRFNDLNPPNSPTVGAIKEEFESLGTLLEPFKTNGTK